LKTFILLLFAYISAFSDLTRLPSEFYVVERFLSFSSSFDVSTDLEPFASARKQCFSLTSSFDLVDMHERPLASASAHFIALGTVVDIFDPEGEKIGWIEEEIFRIFPWAEYRVFNNENQIVAIAKMNFWGTEFELYHPDDETEIYATISRPFIKFIRDYWTVQINNMEIFEDGTIDPRLLVILAIYQTDKDNRDYYRKLFLNEVQNELDYYDEYRIDNF